MTFFQRMIAPAIYGGTSAASAALATVDPTDDHYIPWDHAYSTDGVGFRSLALADASATPIWPNETHGRGARLDGSTGLVCRGVPGSYAYVEDSAALSVTSSLGLVAYVTMQDWTPPASARIINKSLSTGSQRSFHLSVELTTGKLVLTTSADGSSTVVASKSTAGTGFTDGTGHWVAVFFDDTANTTNFYTSDDAKDTALASITWTQLGTADVAHASAGIFDSTANVDFGAAAVDGAATTGTIACAAIYSGGAAVVSTHISGGTCVLDSRFYAQAANTLAFTESSASAHVVRVVQGGGAVVADGILHTPSTTTGIVGDAAVTPSAAANTITGDITMLGYWRAADWTTGTTRNLLQKYSTTGANRAYRLSFHTTNVLRALFSLDGTAALTITASTAPTLTDGTGAWLAVTREASSGDVKFWQASGTGTEDPTALSWSQVGTTQSSTVGSLATTTGDVSVNAGGDAFTSSPFDGQCLRAQVRSGSTIATSTLAVDFNPQGRPNRTASWVASTGERWTIYSNTALVHQTAIQQPVLAANSTSFNGQSVLSMDGVNDYVRSVIAYGSEQPVTVVGIARFTSVPAAIARLMSTNSADSGFGIGGAATGKWSEAQTSTVTGTTDIGTTPVLLRWEFEASGTASKFYVNEVEVASGDLGVVAFNRFAVGGGAAGSNFAASHHAFWGVLKDGPVTAQSGWAAFKQLAARKYGLSL